METSRQLAARNPADIIPELMRFARMVQNLANRFKGLTRFLAISGLVSALLLDWLLVRAWAWSGVTAVILGAILILPGLLLGWCWYLLDEAGSLPQRLAAWTGQARDYAGDVVQRVKGGEPPAEKAARVSDLRKLGGLAYEITSMGFDAKDLLSILGGTLSLTNPLFLLMVAIASVLIVGLDLSAIIWVLVALVG